MLFEAPWPGVCFAELVSRAWDGGIRIVVTILRRTGNMQVYDEFRSKVSNSCAYCIDAKVMRCHSLSNPGQMMSGDCN